MPTSAKDCPGGITVGEVITAVAEALSHDDVALACDVIDRMFIDAGWDFVFDKIPPFYSHDLKRDIRGMIVAAYKRGYAQGRAGE